MQMFSLQMRIFLEILYNFEFTMTCWNIFVQVQLKPFFDRHFGAPDVASVVYWGGLYKLHCHMIKVCLAYQNCNP